MTLAQQVAEGAGIALGFQFTRALGLGLWGFFSGYMHVARGDLFACPHCARKAPCGCPSCPSPGCELRAMQWPSMPEPPGPLEPPQ